MIAFMITLLIINMHTTNVLAMKQFYEKYICNDERIFDSRKRKTIVQ